MVLPVACEAASGGATARRWCVYAPNRLFHGGMRGPLCHRRYTPREDAVSFYVRKNCSGNAGRPSLRRGHFREARMACRPTLSPACGTQRGRTQKETIRCTESAISFCKCTWGEGGGLCPLKGKYSANHVGTMQVLFAEGTLFMRVPTAAVRRPSITGCGLLNPPVFGLESTRLEPRGARHLLIPRKFFETNVVY